MSSAGLASGNVPVTYTEVPSGFRGTDATVEQMRRLSMGAWGSRSPKIRALAINVLRSAGVPEKNYAAEMRTLFHWVRDNIRYTRDVHGQETLSPPEEVAFNSRAGDCDDKSMLLAAMLGAVGIPSRFKVLGITPHQYSHVYLQARIGSQWISLDPIMRGKPAGWEAPAHMRAIEKVYPENVPEGVPMARRTINGLGYVGDPRVVSHLESDPPAEAPTGPYVSMESFLDNDAPIEQLSNNPPAFAQNANLPPRMGNPVAQRMQARLRDRRMPADAVSARVAAEQARLDGMEDAAMMPGMGIGDVWTPEQLAAIGPADMDAQPRPNMQRPALAATPEGIDVAFGRNALVMRADRGDRVAYRGLWALNERPPVRRVGNVAGLGGVAPGTAGPRMLPGMGYMASRRISGPGLADLAETEVASPEAPAPAPSRTKPLLLLAAALGGLYLLTRRK